MRKGSETNIPKNLLISCSYELCSFHDYNKHCKYLYAASQVVSFVLSRSIFNFPHSAFTVQRHRALHTLLSKLLHRLNNKWIKFSLTLIMSLFINLSVTVINSVTEQKKKVYWLLLAQPGCADRDVCWLRATCVAWGRVRCHLALGAPAPALEQGSCLRGEKGSREEVVCQLVISMREKTGTKDIFQSFFPSWFLFQPCNHFWMMMKCRVYLFGLWTDMKNGAVSYSQGKVPWPRQGCSHNWDAAACWAGAAPPETSHLHPASTNKQLGGEQKAKR